MKYVDYLKDLKGCPFCDISKVRILENESAYLTYSAAPYHPDHLLVIPQRHIEHILDLTNEETNDIDALVRRGLEILTKLGHTNISVLVKEGDKTEKSISHTHYHIIPDIVLGNVDHTGIDRLVLSDSDVTKLVARIKAASVR